MKHDTNMFQEIGQKICFLDNGSFINLSKLVKRFVFWILY